MLYQHKDAGEIGGDFRPQGAIFLHKLQAAQDLAQLSTWTTIACLFEANSITLRRHYLHHRASDVYGCKNQTAECFKKKPACFPKISP